MVFRRTRKVYRHRRGDKNVIRHNVLLGVVFLVVVILVMGGVRYVTRLPAFTLREIHVEGGKTIPRELVVEKVESVLKGHYLAVIPYTFAYTYPENVLLAHLESIPRIKDVEVTRISRTELEVDYDEYEPYALWCLSQDTSEPCYFLAQNGFAFTEAPALKGGSLVRFVSEGTDTLHTGQVFDESVMAAVDAFISRLDSELSLRVNSVYFTKDGDIKLSINGGGELFVVEAMDADATFANLQSVLTSDEFKHLRPGNFKYIDLRFGNKVFVNEEVDTTTGENTEED